MPFKRSDRAVYSPTEQHAIRIDIFRWLDEKLGSGQYEFSRAELRSYTYKTKPVPLVDMQKGIWNPRSFSSTLSIVSMLKSKYADEADLDAAFLRYDYRAGDSADNKKLRVALDQDVPLLYFREVHPHYYVAQYPVFVVADDPKSEVFLIALDESLRFFGDPLHMTGDERRYAERISKVRLHQPIFRARVMRAYSSTCAVCSLKHPDLLDAAHIVSDSSVNGFATVTNGLALCKIHHAAYDRNLLGISAEFKIKIDSQLLDEVDGPMLRHGLQDMDGRTLVLPKQKANYPSQAALAERYAEFAA